MRNGNDLEMERHHVVREPRHYNFLQVQSRFGGVARALVENSGNAVQYL
jgi:hypothetical protein